MANKCDPMSTKLYELAMNLASRDEFNTFDRVFAELSRTFPGLTRGELARAFVNVDETRSIQKDELSAVWAEIKATPRLEKEVADRVAFLEQHYDEGTLPPVKERSVKERSDLLTELRNLRDDLRKEINRSEPAQILRLEKSIRILDDAIESGDIMPKPKEAAPIQSDELRWLVYQRDRKRRQIRAEIEARKPKSAFSVAQQPFMTIRALMTSIDWSGLLRQGGFIVFSHPERVPGAVVKMFHATFSDQKAYEIMEEIMNRPNAPLYMRDKLFLAEPGGRLTRQEEYFMSEWAHRIPIIGKGVEASERAYTTVLNVLRADSYDAMMDGLAKNGEVTVEEGRAIANYVNIATGRGNLGDLERAAVTMNTIFFAPRYVVSRFQLILGMPLKGGTAATRKAIAKDYGRYAIGMTAVYTLGMLAGGSLEWDPTKGDFGKIRFGNTRLDPMSGFAQASIFGARSFAALGSLVTGKTEQPGFGGFTYWDTTTFLLRTKLSPALSIPYDALSGENVVHEEIDPSTLKYWIELPMPLALRDIKEAMEEEGVPSGTAAGILSIFGVGIQVYSQKTASLDRSAKFREKSRDNYPEAYEEEQLISDKYDAMGYSEKQELSQPDWFDSENKDWSTYSGEKKAKLYEEHEKDALDERHPDWSNDQTYIKALRKNVDDIAEAIYLESNPTASDGDLDAHIEKMLDAQVEYDKLPLAGDDREYFLRNNRDFYEVWLRESGGHARIDFGT